MAAVLLARLAAATDFTPAAADPLGPIRSRFVAALLEAPPDDAAADRLITTLEPDGRWPGIDYRDVSSTAWQHRFHLQNVLTLSLACRHPASVHRADARALAAVRAALDFWFSNRFEAENWWSNVIGTPRQMIDILFLMDGELSATQRIEAVRIASAASLESRWARPGGDKIQIAGLAAKLAIIQQDAASLRQAVAVMVAEVAVSSERGLQGDLSLQHRNDRVTSTLTYGKGYAQAFAEFADKLAGTPFAFPEPTLRLLIDYYLDGIHKSMAHGRYPDPHQLNRGLTRQNPMRPESPAVPLRLAAASEYRRDELLELVAVRRGEKTPAYSFNKFFWRSEYHTHQRPSFFTSVRMYATRNHSMEHPYNQEGLQNHFLADGASFLIRTGREYDGVFPVYDWRKIPGATIAQKPEMPPPEQIPQRGLTDFVGGLSDGRYGVAAFDFLSPLDGVAARKAWFFFDDEVVCLGSGIRGGAGHAVATTLNQTRLAGDVRLADADGIRTLPRGTHLLQHPRAVWHDGTAYIFPLPPAAVRLSNDAATGNWRSINHGHWATTQPVVRDLFTLWIDHGRDPAGEAYQYRVIPGIDAASLSARLAASAVQILRNAPELQAVRHEALGLTYAVFHKPGTLDWMPGRRLAIDQPGLVMVDAPRGVPRRLAVADPTRQLDAITLRLDANVAGQGPGWRADWDPAAGETRITLALPLGDEAGTTRIAIFAFDE